MTYAGSTSRSSNRVLIFLVVVTIAVVAFWAVTGGLDDIQSSEGQTTSVVSE